MTFPRKYKYNKKDFIVQKTDSGDLLISVKALESLVLKCIDTHEEINLKSMKVAPAKGGILVRMKIAMANNISIPLATESLQKQIKQYVMASAGVKVENVIVAVETTSGEASVGNSPYAVAQEEEKKESEKLPHLRMFSKEDEPMNMPTPQEAEQAAEVTGVENTIQEAAVEAAEQLNENVQAQVSEAAEQIGETVENAVQTAEETVKDAIPTENT